MSNDNNNNQTRFELPVLALRSLVLLPGTSMPLQVGRPPSVRAVEEALAGDGKLLLAPQLSPDVEQPVGADLLRVGVTATVQQVIRHGKERLTVIAQGEERVAIREFTKDGPSMRAIAETFDDAPPETESTRDLVAHAKDLLATILDDTAEDPERATAVLEGIMSPGAVADFAAARIDLPRERLLGLLMNPNPVSRLEDVLPDLDRHVEVLEVKADIHDELIHRTSATERERVLRQRMRSIQEELGEDPDTSDTDDLSARIDEADMPDEVREAATKQVRRLRQMSESSPEFSSTRTYVEWLLDVPWSKLSEEKVDVADARRVLDEHHDGLAKVKKRILEFIAVRKLAPGRKSPILCLAGPPGVGKTSLGRSIAETLGREYVRAALGGVRDESEIRGHRRTYVGALPGRIVASLKKAGTMNPVFVLDEIDKLASGVRGDPASALLEVLDPEQNDTFADHYLEVPVDLSKVMFICTANNLETIPGPLRDRLEIIEIPSYTESEKVSIARNHLLPRQLREHGLDEGRLQLTEAALHEVVTGYTREAGVRNLERELGAVCRAAAVQAASDEDWVGASYDLEEIEDILGPRRFHADLAEHADQLGVVAGLSWTPVGGDLLFIEARRMPGKGVLKLTGQVGSVMEESMRAAYSYLRANADRYGIASRVFAEDDVHIHVPAGAIRKDGPSAGVAITTALVSLFGGRLVRSDVAITGEVTLRGKVLPVGGIKEKVLAAHRAGIATVILPERSAKDLHDVPQEVLDDLDIHPVSEVEEALRIALVDPADRVQPGGTTGGSSRGASVAAA